MRDAPPPCRQDVAAPSLQVGASPPSGPGCPAALPPAAWRPAPLAKAIRFVEISVLFFLYGT